MRIQATATQKKTYESMTKGAHRFDARYDYLGEGFGSIEDTFNLNQSYLLMVVKQRFENPNLRRIELTNRVSGQKIIFKNPIVNK